ncbi:J domain-containing protein [Caulobacter sp. 17J65-9]|uniref:J domain-containing protein n=1 Tax=Caulobacter sp. 17J65-9 TaxID=2709382 RepID=UPI0013CCDD34|nr:J domain-containing protein [Caulobacter sp. 17J65-9]NEX94228.1 J domain-containing protein [Caulobacter sp. 17J65-9]
MTPPWIILGVARDAERADIRRAYSRKLKLANPEDDAEGFQALREAYEAMLRWADHRAAMAAAGVQVEAEGEAEVDRPDASPEPAAPEPVAPESVAPEPVAPVELARPAIPAAQLEAALRRDAELAREAARTLAERQAAAEEAISEEKAHAALCEALRAMVVDGVGWIDGKRTRAALEAVLASPAMDQLGVYERTEQWLVGLIVRGAPRSNPLIDPAVQRFGWDQPRLGRNLGGPVLARRADLDDLRPLKSTSHRRHRAYKALTQKPERFTTWKYRATPSLAKEVAELLALVRNQRPGLMADLDAEAVAWWEAYFAKPHVGPTGILLTAIAPVILAFALNSGGEGFSDGPGFLPTWAACLGTGLALVLGRVYLVEWPRIIWTRDRAATAPAWQRLGWAPAALVLAVLAILLPASTALTITLSGLAAVVLLWAAITGQPDRDPGHGEPFQLLPFLIAHLMVRPKMRAPWQVRALFAHFYLLVFWLFVVARMPGVSSQSPAPLLAAAAAFILGGQSLIDAWRASPARARAWVLAGGVAVTLTTAALFWVASPYPALRPVVVALAVSLVLLHKIPAVELREGVSLVRDQQMRFGWFGMMILFVCVQSLLHDVMPVREKDMGLVVAGWWVLGGVLTALGVPLWAERAALWGAPRPVVVEARKRA